MHRFRDRIPFLFMEYSPHLIVLIVVVILLSQCSKCHAQTRSLTVNSTGVVNEITGVAIPEIALASGASFDVPYASGTVVFTEPIYVDLDTDYSNLESLFVIGTTVSISAHIDGDTDGVNLFLSIQLEDTLNDLNALPEDTATDLWVNTYDLVDGGSIEDVFSINFISPASTNGQWLRFRWEARWVSLGLASSVSENTVRLNLLDQAEPELTPTQVLTPTPVPTDQPSPTPTYTHTPSPSPTAVPTDQQIVRQFYLNQNDTRAVPLALHTSQYSGGSKEILAATNYFAYHDYDGTLKIFGTRQQQ